MATDARRADYHGEIRAQVTPEDAVRHISGVPEWWGTNYEGSASRVGDTFTVRFANGDRYTIRVAELEPHRVVWDVTDAFQGWVSDSSEWVGTRIVWAIDEDGNGVLIGMTHEGLGPNLECFDRCTGGWDYLLQESLARLFSEGAGRPV